MTRIVTVGAAQLGPIARDEPRNSVVARMITLMRQAREHGCDVVAYPELALTTFFPRWYLPQQAEIDAFFEREMPSAETAPLFAEAAKLGIGFMLGYAELVQEEGRTRRFNTSILVDKAGKIALKYRKVHLPAAGYQGGLLLSEGDVRKAHFDHFRRRLDLCQQFNIRTMLIVADFVDKVDATSLHRAMSSLAQSAQWAAGYDVTLALEFRAKNAFCASLDTAVALVAPVRPGESQRIFATDQATTPATKPTGAAYLPYLSPSDIDGATDIVDLPYDLDGASLVTGDAVVYSAGGGTPVGGLVDGGTYYVVMTGPHSFRLAATKCQAAPTTGGCPGAVLQTIDLTPSGATGRRPCLRFRSERGGAYPPLCSQPRARCKLFGRARYLSQLGTPPRPTIAGLFIAALSGFLPVAVA